MLAVSVCRVFPEVCGGGNAFHSAHRRALHEAVEALGPVVDGGPVLGGLVEGADAFTRFGPAGRRALRPRTGAPPLQADDLNAGGTARRCDRVPGAPSTAVLVPVVGFAPRGAAVRLVSPRGRARASRFRAVLAPVGRAAALFGVVLRGGAPATRTTSNDRSSAPCGPRWSRPAGAGRHRGWSRSWAACRGAGPPAARTDRAGDGPAVPSSGVAGQRGQQVGDHGDPSPALVVAVDDVPGALGGVGVDEHLVLGAGVVLPPGDRVQVGRGQLPAAHRVVEAAPEAAVRGLRYPVIRLIVPPLPAASRTSNTTTSPTRSTRAFTDSACNRSGSALWAGRRKRSPIPPVTAARPPRAPPRAAAPRACGTIHRARHG